jgi:hypothetical protein
MTVAVRICGLPVCVTIALYLFVYLTTLSMTQIIIITGKTVVFEA